MMNSMAEPTSQPGTPSRRFRYSAIAPLPTCSLSIEMMYALARMGRMSAYRILPSMNQFSTLVVTRVSTSR